MTEENNPIESTHDMQYDDIVYDSDSSDGSDGSFDDHVAMVNQYIINFDIAPVLFRNPSRKIRDKIDWAAHMEGFSNEEIFATIYRMSRESFEKLITMVTPYMDINPKYFKRSTSLGEHTPYIIMHCVLRWLAGGSFLDIMLLLRISKTTFFRLIRLGLDAILSCKELMSIKFPSILREIETMAENFTKISAHRIFTGCVGCIDGYLLNIKKPTVKEADNRVSGYFSCHYQLIGINVQAVCDHLCRITHVTLAASTGLNSGIKTRE